MPQKWEPVFHSGFILQAQVPAACSAGFCVGQPLHPTLRGRGGAAVSSPLSILSPEGGCVSSWLYPRRDLGFASACGEGDSHSPPPPLGSL